jgi:hypothetical protein
MKFGTPVAESPQGPFVTDLLFSGNIGPLGAAGTVTVALTAQQSYSALWINNGGGAFVANAKCVSAYNLTMGPLANGQAWTAGTGPQELGLYVPIVCNAGDSLRVTYSVSGATGTAAVEIFGLLTGAEGLPPMRSDGRYYPKGLFIATGSLVGGTGPVTVIPAPGTPTTMRLLLKWLQLTSGTAGNFFTVTGTINSAAVPLAQVFNQATSLEWESGQLLDANTAVTLSASGASTGAVQIGYDIVST